MTPNNIFRKCCSLYLLLHLAAMLLVVALVVGGVWIWLGFYTHHGQAIRVPNLEGMSFEKAHALLEQDGLGVAVSDSGYNKELPAGSVLAQNPDAGSTVKQGRTIYVTLNALHTPTVAIPDVIENSSYREAAARLTALGFKLQEPRRIAGERDWVYGIEAQGKALANGQLMPIGTQLTLIVGSGNFEEDEDDVLEGEYNDDEDPLFDDMTSIDDLDI